MSISPSTIPGDSDRDRPTGAGAAPAGPDRKPRAEPRRGRPDQRSLKFYGQLNQIPPIAKPTNLRPSEQYRVRGQIIALGEFRGLGRWLTTRFPPPALATTPSPESLVKGADNQSAGSREASNELGALLEALAEEVHQHATAARDGVLMEFAARIAHARKHLSPQLFAATLGAIKEQRKAALALISRTAALELAARRKAAIAACGGEGPRKPEIPNSASLCMSPQTTPKP